MIHRCHRELMTITEEDPLVGYEMNAAVCTRLAAASTTSKARTEVSRGCTSELKRPYVHQR